MSVGSSSKRRFSPHLAGLLSSEKGSCSSVGNDTLLLPSYDDIGDCTFVCRFCSAFFWFDERVMYLSRPDCPAYTRCCKSGSVVLPYPLLPPKLLLALFDFRPFIKNIRAYNSMFSMTSFGGKVDDTVNRADGPYVFKVSGQVCHWIGAFDVVDEKGPKFLQLYIVDTDHELHNRLSAFPKNENGCLDSTIVEALMDLFTAHNEYVRTFKCAKDIAAERNLPEYAVRLFNDVPNRLYGPPAPGSLGCIVVGEDVVGSTYDIVVHSKSGPPRRISKLHPSYMPLQYPVLFPYGKDGWSPRLKLLNEQYLVDAYACIELSRLDFYEQNQNHLRSAYVSGIYDAISRGDTDGRSIGKRVILPPSFVGGPRYMDMHRQFDVPSRADIISRVFHMKVIAFISYLKSDKTFGPVTAHLYTIEFQKRGLPHCHVLIWIADSHKIKEPSAIDAYITAELPDPILEPLLYQTVTRCLVHGPCGLLNTKSSCMKDGKCKKRFPKNFRNDTVFDKDGYAHYKRRSGEVHRLETGVEIDNRFIVPYNKRLCCRFNAHINVEYCGWNMMIKYLFKYVSKGMERVRFVIQRDVHTSGSSVSVEPPVIDEIKNYIDGRFLCPHEAAWRILDFPIHDRDPSIVILPIHLPNMQSVLFKENISINQVVDDPNFGSSLLLGWFDNNKWDRTGHNLTYSSYPTKYWSYEEVRTVSGTVYSDFRATCDSLGLIGEDREWMDAFTEASEWATSSQLRSLFCYLLLLCDVNDPMCLWHFGWKKMSDDLVHNIKMSNPGVDVIIDDLHVQQMVLYELDHVLRSSTPSKSVVDFHLPKPTEETVAMLRNRLFLEETTYDKDILKATHQQMLSSLNDEQLNIYNVVQSAEAKSQQMLLFVYGHFLWTTILAYFRSRGKIALAVAASGIASLLLPSGRTAHSRFKIPIDFTDNVACNITKKTMLAELLKVTSIIIWDEAPMSDKHCFECLDHSLRDILECESKVFGGMSMLLGGDFRQTLPVSPKTTPSEIISLTLPNSYLWPYFSLYKLTDNMRLKNLSTSSDSHLGISKFASWLLQIGDGLIGEIDACDKTNTKWVEIPMSLIIPPTKNALHSLIDFVYGDDILKKSSASTLSARAIVCPKNETIQKINDIVLQRSPGDSKMYESADSIEFNGNQSTEFNTFYPLEYLNALTFPSIPVHSLHVSNNNNNLRIALWVSGTAIQVESCVCGHHRLEIMRHGSWLLTKMVMCSDSGQRKDQSFLQSVLIPSRCYTIEKYGCGVPDRYQKWINNEFYMAVGTVSSITPLPDTAIIPKHWFSFVSKTQIPDYKDQHADFVGFFSKLINCTKKDSEPYLLLILKNDSGEDIAISLWKEFTSVSSKFDRVVLENAPAPVIVAITSIKISTYAGALRLGTSSATHLYINPPIPEMKLLMDSYNTLPEVPVFLDPPIQLSKILDKSHSDLSDRTLTTKACIIEYIFSDSWYHVQCPKCKNTTFKQGKNWFCPSDGILESPCSTFKLNAVIKDESHSMTVVLSDNATQELLGTTADNLRSDNNTDDRKEVPPIAISLLGTPRKMKIRMTNTSKDNNIRFIVTNIEKMPSEVPPSMTTPPPDRPTSSKNTNEESAQNYQQSKQNVRRSLPFENPVTTKRKAARKME
ncbi:unnamed protein product [Lactuca saligna]|uniref:ATP-dependent DNA helicase n=1 Tax=Lactuca saligna TaxID=75948 RepID=A0AA35US54_LACSI|nr:unnamed protein product [Lactuca saligna]